MLLSLSSLNKGCWLAYSETPKYVFAAAAAGGGSLLANGAAFLQGVTRGHFGKCK